MLAQGTSGAVQKNGIGAGNINALNNDGRTPTKRNGLLDGNKASQGDANLGKGSQNQPQDASSKKRTLNEMLNNQGPGTDRTGNLDIQMQNFSIGSGDNTEGAQIE